MSGATHRARLRWPLVSSGGVVVLLALLAQTHMAVGSQGIPVLAVFVQRDLGLTRTELGLFSATAQVGAGASMLLGGWLADRLGVRRAVALGLGLIGLALATLPVAGTLAAAMPFLLVAGVGNGVASPPITLAILHWLPLRLRAVAMGLKQTGVPLAGVLLAAGVPPLAEVVGWRVAALVVGGTVLVMAALWAGAYRDAPGRARAAPRLSARAVGDLLRHPGMASVSLFAAIAAAAQFALLSYLILFLYERRDFPIVFAGLVLAAAQAGSLVGRIGWGVVSDRLLRGARKPALCAAGGLGALALAALVLLPTDLPAVAFATALALGVSVLAWQALHQVAVAELAGAERAGQAIGLTMAILQVGAIVGAPLFGFLVDRTGSYELAWLLFAALLAVSVVAVAVGWREQAGPT